MRQLHANDYIHVLKKHWLDSDDFYLNEKYTELACKAFEEVAVLMSVPCSFNQSFPDSIRETMLQYASGNPHTVSAFEDASLKALFLSNLRDYLYLFCGRAAAVSQSRSQISDISNRK